MSHTAVVRVRNYTYHLSQMQITGEVHVTLGKGNEGSSCIATYLVEVQPPD
jgi:hypothetical protein